MTARLEDARLDVDVFRLLGQLMNERAGLSLGPEGRPAVERRLRERLGALGLTSFGEYYRYLCFHQRGSAELDEAIELVTVNETYFFRENYQIRAFSRELLPLLRARRAGHPLSIWSAGCSTGEEVYTIAIALLEAGLRTTREARVFGSDISRRCVSAARRGVYGRSSFRVMPADLRARYFDERPDGAHVNDDVRALCHFGYLNLLDPARAALVGRTDVIFCRNVLIYLDEASRRKVIDIFYDRLRPGGYLLLGHSESLLHLSTEFELCHLRDDLVYRKPLATARLGAPPRSRRSLR